MSDLKQRLQQMAGYTGPADYLGGDAQELCRDALKRIRELEFDVNACRGAALAEVPTGGLKLAILKITAAYDLTGKVRT